MSRRWHLVLVIAAASLVATGASAQQSGDVDYVEPDDLLRVPDDPISGFRITHIDGKGVALWWDLMPGLGGNISLLRGTPESKTPPVIVLPQAPAVGPVPGYPDWQVVHSMPTMARGARDRAPVGEHVYLLVHFQRKTRQDGVEQWQSAYMTNPVNATVVAPVDRPTDVAAVVPDNDSGQNISVRWSGEASGGATFLILRGDASFADAPIYSEQSGEWSPGWVAIEADSTAGSEQEATIKVEPGKYRFAVAAIRRAPNGKIAAVAVSEVTPAVAPRADWFDEGAWGVLAIIVLMALGLWYYIPRVRRAPDSFFIRRIAGVDAIEDSIGRATEMGRPVLYVTGTENVQNIQTIASLLCLGPVAEMTAEYDTELKVANFEALTMVVAEEIVRQGYANAGRADAHRPENCMFISSEQFAFAAGVNGMILRDRPATNIYLGRFFAESLMLAETGYVTKSIQIAGTAEVTQLPFFVAACDYTIIGEELYAVSAYLSKDPRLIATLKATDLVKFIVIVVIVIGSLNATLDISDWLKGVLSFQ